MKIVIDISEKKYKSICDHFMFMYETEVMFAVKNGIPLIEGDNRLINDAIEIIDEIGREIV